MSSRREVLIRILALLTKDDVTCNKKSQIKIFKTALFDCAMKSVAVLTEDGAFAFFCRPHTGGFDSSRVPTPENLPSKAKKC